MNLVLSKRKPESLEALGTARGGDDAKSSQKVLSSETHLQEMFELLSELQGPARPARSMLLRAAKKMHGADNIAFRRDEWTRIRSVVAVETLMCLYASVRLAVLGHLSRIDERIQYFEARRANVLSDLVHNGFSYWQSTPTAMLTGGISGIRSWFSSMLFARKIELRRRVRKLRMFRRLLLCEAAKLHARLDEMEKLDSFAEASAGDQSPMWPFADALHCFLEGSEPAWNRDDPFSALLHLMESTSVSQASLGTFEDRVVDYMEYWDLKKPSHISRNWIAYLCAISGALFLTQTQAGWSMLISTGSVIKGVANRHLIEPSKRLCGAVKTLAESAPVHGEALAQTKVALLERPAGDSGASKQPARGPKPSTATLATLSADVTAVRGDIDKLVKALQTVLDFNFMTFRVLVCVPPALVVWYAGAGLRLWMRHSSRQRSASIELRRLLREVEAILISTRGKFDTTGRERNADLELLGQLLHHVHRMAALKEYLPTEAAGALADQLTGLENMGSDLEQKLRIVTQMHRTHGVLQKGTV